MDVTVNLKFTDEELRNYASDVGRRWITHAIHAVVVHAPAMKPPAGFMEMILQALTPNPAGDAKAPDIDAEYDPPKKCVHVQADANTDEAWMCHECGAFNNENRSICRRCDHVRCDEPGPVASAESS